MFWMRNKENNFSIHTFIWRPVPHLKRSFFFLQSIVNMKVVRSAIKHLLCGRKVYVFVDIGMLGLLFKHLPRDLASVNAVS